MLWSQIKLAPYNFSDLQITGEFDNQPGTGRFFGNFLVVTYRTSAGRRLYIITSADARHGTVHGCNKCSRAMMYTLISTFAIIPPK